MPDIDWDKIGEKEGNLWTDGYIPILGSKQYTGKEKPDKKLTDKIVGNSGVTIATGFDIGQHNQFELNKLDLPQAIKDKLKPFIGLKRAPAAKKLHEKKGVRIDEKQAKQINVAVKKSKVGRIQTLYNRKALEKKKDLQFQQLPSEIQTAIVSFGFQYGQNFILSTVNPKKTFADLITSQDWDGAADYLQKLTSFASRRKMEADLIRKGIPKLTKAREAK